MSDRRDEQRSGQRSVMVTGAAGYIGQLVVQALAKDSSRVKKLVAMDLRAVAPDKRIARVDYIAADIGSPLLGQMMAENQIDTVIHLAAMVTPPKGPEGEKLAYRVDVEGTQNVLSACLKADVEKLILTSSGAAYGYHPDNPEGLCESDPLRGNPEFAYSHHKRLVEEMLAQTRIQHPQLKQLVFRPGTIIGKTVANQITDLFEKKAVIGLWGIKTPFVFIWDRDVVDALVMGVHTLKTGIYNLAGDGVLTLNEIAKALNKPFLPIPVALMKTALAFLHRIGWTQYGPEQVVFLQYRPVLLNDKLKSEFGFTPSKTSREAFEIYRGRHA